MSSESVQRLKSRLGRRVAERRTLIETARRENRGGTLTTEQDAEFRGITADIEVLQERLEDLEHDEERSAAADAARARVGGSSFGPPSVYGPESRSSYFSDLVNVSRQTGSYEARERLATYEVEQRDLNRTDGSGGMFVPPSWLISDYVGLPRAGRVTADLLTRRMLPAGTDSINIPRVLTGTATAIQPADNDPVQETDLTDSVITAPVRTIAGQQDVALQLLDQSPVNFDQVVLGDLMADYARRLDTQVLAGTGTSGQLLGLQSVSGIETVTWTSASPTANEFQLRVADATSRIASALFAPPTAIVMHPRRWSWLLSQNDSQNRPLIVPSTDGPMNARGLLTGGAEGRVGTFCGLDVLIDANLTTTAGAGSNQDVVLVLAGSESILFESTIRTRVLPEPLAGTLTVRIQLWNYVAMATRQAKSVAVLSGTGLVTPTFV